MVSVSRLMNRLANGFVSQVVRRGLRAVGMPQGVIPVAVSLVRQLNRPALWGRRFESAKRMYEEFLTWQRQVSPVYRFRGGSPTVRPYLSQETVRDKYRDPNLRNRWNKIGDKCDTSTVLVSGLGIVVLGSLGGPWLAKKINYVDPLDAREAGVKSVASSNFDLKF